jgi:hypothetical protein
MKRFFSKNYLPGFDRFSTENTDSYPKESVLKRSPEQNTRLNKIVKKLKDLKSNKMLQSKK